MMAKEKRNGLPPSRTRSKTSCAPAACRRTSRCCAARTRAAARWRTGIAGLDELLLGGFPRGQISEVHGACSSGRTALVLALAARLTRAGSLVAWVDPGDRLDPGSAAAAGVHLARLLWLRGERRGRDTRALLPAVSAVGTLLGSGLFEAVVFDLAGIAGRARQRLPGDDVDPPAAAHRGPAQRARPHRRRPRRPRSGGGRPRLEGGGARGGRARPPRACCAAWGPRCARPGAACAAPTVELQACS